MRRRMPRIPAELVLRHPTRAAILLILHEHPGLCFRQLVRRTGVASGTLAHHLNVLRRNGQIWSSPLGPRILHFSAPKPDPRIVRRMVVDHVLPDLDQRLLGLLRTEGPCRQAALLDRFAPEPRSNVQHHLYRLCKQGFIREARQGRYVRYEALA